MQDLPLEPVQSISLSRVLPVCQGGEIIRRVDDRTARQLLKQRKVVPVWSQRSIVALQLIDDEEREM